MAASNVETFIKKFLKYRACKCYVGCVSGNSLYEFRKRMDETEFTGQGYAFFTGALNLECLRAAFQREMAYNPARFGGAGLPAFSPQAEVAAFVKSILQEFSILWPNGIQSEIRITDPGDSRYRFLLRLRDCFKKIAFLNMQDFKKSSYRAEIIAVFANASNIKIPADVRAQMQAMAATSASRREEKRMVAEIQHRISAIEAEIQIHRAHDRSFVGELRKEIEELRDQLDVLKRKKSAAPKKRPAAKTNSAPVISNVTQAPVVPCIAEDIATDAAEREEELLSTITPEHDLGGTPDVFLDYIKQFGVRKR